MDVIFASGFVVIAVLGFGVILFNGRSKLNRPPKQSDGQKHKPHSLTDTTAEQKRLQNDGSISPGALGGGGDFGPS